MSTNLRRAPTDNDRFGYSHLWKEAGLGHTHTHTHTHTYIYMLSFLFLMRCIEHFFTNCNLLHHFNVNSIIDQKMRILPNRSSRSDFTSEFICINKVCDLSSYCLAIIRKYITLCY